MKNYVFLIALSIIMSGCDVLNSNNTVTLTQLQAQFQDIQNFVNEGDCSGGGECSYFPIGSKACGGPTGYIIFSNNIDIATLKKMVEKYTEDQKTYNVENNVISDCRFVSPPEKIDCIDRSCVEIR